jgi:hypothetical protein
MQLNSYSTLAAFRLRQGLASSDTGGDARMLAKLRAATSQIERFTGRTFNPNIAMRRFDWRSPRLLFLKSYDLLELTTLTNGDVTTIDQTAILTYGGVNGPIVGIELDITKAVFIYQTTRTRAIAITGVWGWHDDYAYAWKPSGDAIPGGGVTSSATTFTVTSVNGSDGWGLTPRFSAGQLIKVDSEYMHVIGADGVTNTLTVVRAANGSTAATHNAATAISIYAPPVDIQEITLRWAAWLYRMEDSGDFSSPVGDQPLVSVAMSAPLAIPADLLATLENLRRVGVAGGVL